MSIALCVKCEIRPRGAGGRLTRCMPCIKVDAQRDREARELVRARFEARRKGQKPTSNSHCLELRSCKGDTHHV